MRRDEIETDYGYNDELGATVWINCTNDKLGKMVMDKGRVIDEKWWENKIKLGKHIHKKKIIL